MSGEGPPPPRKPPAPPASPSPGDDEGDDFPEFAPAQGDELASDEILKESPKERAARLKREQDAKIKRQKDNLAAQRRREREDQAMAFRQRRKDIQSSAKQAQSQITETSEASGSSRMIRRLASFGIGRAIGGSGSLFAAAAEFGVFQPEEERARQETAQARQDVSARKEKELADLERDIFQTKRAADIEKQRVDQAVEDARLGLKGAKSDQERESIMKQLEKDMEPIPTATMIGGPPAAGRGRGGSGGGQPPSGSSSAGGGGPRRLTDSQLDAASFGTLIYADTIKAVTEAATKEIQSFGALANINPLTQSGINQAGTFAGQKVGNASRIGGAGLGGLAGFAVGGPAGALFGAGIGAATGSLVDPIVEAIKQGNSLLENFTKNSLDFDTIATSANEDIATLLRKIEADEAVSDQTVEFRKSQGDLTRSIIGLQEALIKEFGPSLSQILKAMATVITLLGKVADYGTELVDAFLRTLPFGDVLVPILQEVLELLASMNDAIKDGIGDDPSIAQDVIDFFSTQNQFQGFQNGKPVTRFGGNVNAFANP
jgi:hypothetical protein